MAVKRWNGTAWEVYAGSDLAPVKVTDGRVGKTTFIGATTPTGMVDGDIWIDQDTTTNAVVPTALLAKGDIFVATGNGAYTRLAAGNNGESLYADSTTSTGLRWQGNSHAGKNLVINGGFDVWQRGTSFAYSNSTYVYSADRFEHVRNAYTLGATASRQAAQLEGFRYCLRVQRDSGTSSTQPIFIDHSMDTVESLRVIGKTVTLSFYARKGANYSASSNILTGRIITGTGTDQALKNYTNAAIPISIDCVLSDSWQRFSVTGVVTAGVNEIGLNFVSTPTGTAGANDYYEITGIQLELGSVATPFSRAGGTLAGELAICQRYYQRFTSSESNTTLYSPFGSGFVSGSSTLLSYVPFKGTMRVAPSFASSGASTLGTSTPAGGTQGTGVSMDHVNNTGARIVLVVAGGLTSGWAGILNAYNSNSAYLEFSAEL
jgi:hypothetical protein